MLSIVNRVLIVMTIYVQSQLIVHIKLIHVLKNPQKVTCFKVGIEMKRLDPPHWMLISYNNNNNSRVFVYKISFYVSGNNQYKKTVQLLQLGNLS